MADYNSIHTGVQIDNAISAVRNADNAVVASKSGNGAPTNSTAGRVGDLYTDTATGDLYWCATIEGEAYGWRAVGASGAGSGNIEVDASLTVRGMAADAKATGDAIREAVDSFVMADTITSEEIPLTFTRGTLDSSGALSSSNNRIVSDFIFTSSGLTITPADGTKIRIVVYDTSTMAFIKMLEWTTQPYTFGGVNCIKILAGFNDDRNVTDYIVSHPEGVGFNAYGNILDSDNFVLNEALSASGTVTTNNGYYRTGYISIIGGKTYTFAPKRRRLCFYTSGNTFISAFDSSTIISNVTAPNNAAKMRVSFATEDVPFESAYSNFACDADSFTENYALYQDALANIGEFVPVTAEQYLATLISARRLSLESSPLQSWQNKQLVSQTLWESGGISSSGGESPSINSCRTSILHLVRGTKIILSDALYPLTLHTYSADTNAHESSESGITTYTASGDTYCRLVVGNSSHPVTPYTANGVVKIYFPPSYNFTWFTGKKCVWNGDSISYGSVLSDVHSAWPYRVCRELNMNLKNYAIGGSTISVKASSSSERDPIVTRYTAMDDDADIVIIAAGTNDWYYNWTEPGTLDTTALNATSNSLNINTFTGALQQLCLGLMQKYPGKPIIFCAPIKRLQTDDTTQSTSPVSVNSYEKTLEEYCDIIKSVCRFYSLPVIDMDAISLLNPFVDPSFFADTSAKKVHPNIAGHKLMADVALAQLKSLR